LIGCGVGVVLTGEALGSGQEIGVNKIPQGAVVPQDGEKEMLHLPLGQFHFFIGKFKGIVRHDLRQQPGIQPLLREIPDHGSVSRPWQQGIRSGAEYFRIAQFTTACLVDDGAGGRIPGEKKGHAGGEIQRVQFSRRGFTIQKARRQQGAAQHQMHTLIKTVAGGPMLTCDVKKTLTQFV
jgi:hypothetical protein